MASPIVQAVPNQLVLILVRLKVLRAHTHKHIALIAYCGLMALYRFVRVFWSAGDLETVQEKSFVRLLENKRSISIPKGTSTLGKIDHLLHSVKLLCN